ncbi:monovalent cation/H+ antiporter complex subunit F [Isoptericola sp. S6320L]|uniref:monovalent cation/H+ antiporter complex subunit F n=1 Tax=Isoptericola sp. S6320L TaxID=2926411 RepID=UPI001FF66BFD|nr:monovalent cation/H+ antiporter complex subunit F [Isoptericola sp. S6320L]MCK0117647.1 monovalent cation/H+ antiporter complex subunit F [Isoptericola sp. S6320L]
MVVVVVIAAVLVAAAALMALVRVERGPSMLDRALGLDLLTASLVCAIAIEAVWSRRTETVPILLALSLVGFVGSVVISRFGVRQSGSRPDVGAESGAPAEAGSTDEEEPV